jgi:hypothetical protein
MRKLLGTATAVILLATATFAAPAAKPKATGDADWINGPGTYNQQANTTFNAINTNATGVDAKGSAIYTDPNITYTMDVQFLKVVGNKAWFAGQVTSVTVTGTNPGCCALGNWIFYKVADNGEPGINADQVWGEDLTAGEGITASNWVKSIVAAAGTINEATPAGGPFVLNGGNLQVHQ